MYKDAFDAGNKNIPPNTFKNIMMVFENPSWLNRDSIYYQHKKSINVPASNNAPANNVQDDPTRTIPEEVALGLVSKTSDVTDEETCEGVLLAKPVV
jgi:hypothetical protein